MDKRLVAAAALVTISLSVAAAPGGVKGPGKNDPQTVVPLAAYDADGKLIGPVIFGSVYLRLDGKVMQAFLMPPYESGFGYHYDEVLWTPQNSIVFTGVDCTGDSYGPTTADLFSGLTHAAEVRQNQLGDWLLYTAPLAHTVAEVIIHSQLISETGSCVNLTEPFSYRPHTAPIDATYNLSEMFTRPLVVR